MKFYFEYHDSYIALLQLKLKIIEDLKKHKLFDDKYVKIDEIIKIKNGHGIRLEIIT